MAPNNETLYNEQFQHLTQRLNFKTSPFFATGKL